MTSFFIENILSEVPFAQRDIGKHLQPRPALLMNKDYDSDDEGELNWAVPRWRKKFTEKQRRCLEQVFRREKYLTVKQREALANEIGLTTQQVKTWYQNRRTKWKKEQYSKAISMGSISGKYQQWSSYAISAEDVSHTRQPRHKDQIYQCLNCGCKGDCNLGTQPPPSLYLLNDLHNLPTRLSSCGQIHYNGSHAHFVNFTRVLNPEETRWPV